MALRGILNRPGRRRTRNRSTAPPNYPLTVHCSGFLPSPVPKASVPSRQRFPPFTRAHNAPNREMEHLPTPPGSRPINVPYLGGQEFEANMSESDDVLYYFKSYWERTGWPRDRQTYNLSFHNRRPEDIAQSLQTSLYFGTLISIFRRVGIPVRTRDFLAPSSPGGEVFVRTTKLPDLVADWLRREGISSQPGTAGDVNDPRVQRGCNISEILHYAFYFLDMYSRETETMAGVYRERMRLVELSIKAMAESLCSVVCEIYGYEARAMPSWGSSPVLAARLRDNGWCDSDSPFFPESMTRASVSADYYFGGLACPRARGDHSRCGTAICKEYCRKITPGKYEQLHTVLRGCTCKAEPVPEPVPIPEQAIRLVEKGQIPVLQWDGRTIHVSVGDDTNAYVAVSHV